MSWLLERWFGSKESLEQVREDIHENLQKEQYLGVSGIDQPELSANRTESKNLALILHGPWENKLENMEEELLQYVHDELPAIVRDEVGIFPFFTNVLTEGFLVLSFIRNAGDRDILIQKLPLSLVTAEGKVVAHKTFDMMTFGPIGGVSSRPCEFLFRWNEFNEVPAQPVPLFLVYEGRGKKSGLLPNLYQDTNGLSSDEVAKYMQIAGEKLRTVPGEVDLKVLEITSDEEGGLKVIVLFSNGLEKRLEFSDVPMLIQDQKGRELARLRYELQNMLVDAQSSRLWTFHVPKDTLKDPDVNPAECKAVIPGTKQVSSIPKQGEKGLMQ